MLPYVFSNPTIPLFEYAKSVAANIAPYGEKGDYTADMFEADFPQFYKKTVVEGVATYESLLPSAMLDSFIELANDSVMPSRWGSQFRYAAGLFVAHWVSLYLKTYQDGSNSAAEVASKAGQAGNVSSATMGDTSISYDNSAINEGSAKWGTWNATQYGAQLATMARMLGIGGTYVI
jgi:hypothetical protein